MKDYILHGLIVTVSSALVAYLNILAVPMVILIAVMLTDYITGMAQAFVSKTLNSRIGVTGIVKKVGYVILVACGIVADYLISSGLLRCGIEIRLNYCVAVAITIWLIINELISIVENLAEMGIPLPKFFLGIIKRLKNTVDKATDNKGDENDDSYMH